MADMTELKNIVRKGIVQSVNSSTMKARVKFPDKGGVVSGELHILTTPRSVVPADGTKEGSRTAETELTFDKDGSPETKSHSHAAYLTNWVPAVDSMVLCLMIPDGDGEGYILGGVK